MTATSMGTTSAAVAPQASSPVSAASAIFLRALRGEAVPYTPIWLMRQAGRYLPEYCATRRRAGSFLHLCHSPELATEVTLQPLARFPLDAAILFSDILTVPEAMGLGLYFAEGEGPRFRHPLHDEAAIHTLREADMDALRYVFDAVQQIRGVLTRQAQAGEAPVPLIGFAGSPFTLACYMIEGMGSPLFPRVKRLLYQRPDLLHRVLEINTKSTIAYLNAQIAAGVQAVQIFDTWGGLLAHDQYMRCSLDYIRRIVAALHTAPTGERIPCIVFTKGGSPWLETIAACGCDAVGLDWTVSLHTARQRIGARMVLQGNLDPLVLLSSPEVISREVSQVLADYAAAGTPGQGHIFNLGHGIDLHTPPEHIAALVEAVHTQSRQQILQHRAERAA